MEFYFMENGKIRYGWGFISLKSAKQGTTGDFFFDEKGKIRYDFRFRARAGQEQGFILLKMKKQGTAVNLFHQNVDIRYT